MVANKILQEIREELNRNLDRIVSLRNQRSVKEDLSFVTKGDMLVNDLIHDLVGNNGGQISIVSEESKHVTAEELMENVIVVDPIDGTENFTSGFPEWGVSVACFHKGTHVASLLGCPEMNLWLQTGDKPPKFFSRIRGLSSSLSMEELIDATRGHEYRILGCCVYNMISVIRGSFLSFENPKGANSWDILAGLNLALENNLKVTVDEKAYSGQYLSADRKYKFRVENQ